MPASTASEAPALLAEGLRVQFRRGRGEVVTALAADRLAIAPGTLCGITGPSGSGKTTLLHALAGLLAVQAGTLYWGTDILAAMGEAARDDWRRRNVGIVFQEFHLIGELSARDNVLLPGWFAATRLPPAAAERAAALLARMGIPDPDQRAARLSRGEQQRVAIARAVLGAPRVLLADEPTASLDAAAGTAVADLLIEAARDLGATLLAVSHDPALLARMDIVHTIRTGVLPPAAEALA